MFSPEAEQIMSDVRGCARSIGSSRKSQPSEIKVLEDDPTRVEKANDEIKTVSELGATGPTPSQDGMTLLGRSFAWAEFLI